MDILCCDVRLARARDLAAINSVMARAAQKDFADPQTGRLDPALAAAVARVPARLLSSSSAALWDVDGAVLGLACWSHETPWGPVGPEDVGHLRHLVIAPESRGQGGGQALIHWLCRDACESGVRILHAHMPVTAAGFFERAGFVRVADVALQFRPGTSVEGVHLQRVLGV